MSFLTDLKDRNARSIAHRRSTIAWAQTPAVKAILDTCEYLKDAYKMFHYLSIDAGYISVILTVRELEGLKDEKLASLLSSLVYSNPDKESSADYAGNFERDFIFSWNHDDPKSGFSSSLTVRVEAHFKEDSETCKRVVVGYQEPSKEPVPIYEIRCADGTKEQAPDGELNHEPEAYLPPNEA